MSTTPPKTESLSTPTRRRSNQIGTGAAVAIAVVLLIVGIAGGYVLGVSLNKTSTTKVNITEAGSTLLEPLMQIWGPNYTKLVNSNVIVSASGGGSGLGQSESEAGTIDIGGSDAYVTGSTGVVDVPVAISSQLVMYNLGPKFADVHLNLNGTILAEIYDGTITTWNDPLIQNANPTVTLPSATIVPGVRTDSSGDTFLFSTYCDMSLKSWKYGSATNAFASSPYTGGSGNSGLIKYLNETKDSIGYIGISYQSVATSNGLGYAALGDNYANSALGGDVKANASAVNNYILWSAANVAEDANLALAHLDYAVDGLAITMILGGSPAGPTTIVAGSNGTNPTATYSTPYPIVNFEYALVKTAPASPSHQAYVVAFLEWAIAYGNSATYLDKVNFVPLTPTIAGYDQEALSTVQISA